MAVFRGFHTIREPKAADAWVRRVTTVKIVNLVRERRLRPYTSWDALPEQGVGPWQSMEARDIAARAVRVMKLLPEKEGALLMTYWFTPATAESLARELGCSIATVKRRLLRARGRFQRLALQDPELAPRFRDPRACSPTDVSESRPWTSR